MPPGHALFAQGKTQLVLGGGAMHGLMYIGVLCSLFRTPAAFSAFRADLRTLAGASMGALLAALLCEWSPWQVWAYATTEQFRAIGSQLIDQSWLDIPLTRSLSSGRALDAALQRGVLDVYGDANISLAAVAARTRKHLVLVVSNISQHRAEYWSARTQPDMPLWLALRASVSIPGLFPPVAWQHDEYVDGGLMCNVPCHLFPPQSTLVMLVHTTARPAAATTPMYATRLWEGFMGAAQLGSLRAVPAYVTSCIPCIPTPDTPDAYAFGAPDAVVDAIVHQGCRSLGVLLLTAYLLLGFVIKSNVQGTSCSGSTSKRPVRASRCTSVTAASV